MEPLAFVGGALVVAVLAVWWVRRRGTVGKEREIEGLPYDLRDKGWPAP